MTRRFHLLVAALIVTACSAVPFFILSSHEPAENTRKELIISARQYAYRPERIVVNRGDQIDIRLGSMDVVHGFYLEGHDIEAEVYPGKVPFRFRHPSKGKEFLIVDDFSFIADRVGKFRYRCSVNCGPLHPFMLGELVVLPNIPFWMSIGAAVGILIAAFYLMMVQGRAVEDATDFVDEKTDRWRLDLLAVFPWLKWLVKRKWIQFAMVLPGLFFMMLFFVAGFFGSVIGNRNIIITFVWMLWWFLLIAIFLPFGARIWCLLCPIPFIGEWLQRRRFLGPTPASNFRLPQFLHGMNRVWPKKLSNIWLQNFLFLGMCTFSSMLITRPSATAVALLSMTIVATAMHVIYRRRTFCLYVCPVSGFLSLYAMASMVEIRAKSAAPCQSCSVKSGIFGSPDAWACPWFRRPHKLDRNNYCGFCMECIKACPHDNMTIKARPFCSDERIDRYDEAWKSFIMITLALFYSIVLMGPSGTWKDWANVSEMGNWWGFGIYTLVLWASALVLLPGLWGGAAWIGRQYSGTRSVSVKTLFLRYSYLLVPLGLMTWIVFSVPLILINGTYILTTISDPLGWGWNLFGTAQLRWKPLIPEYIFYIQAPLMLLGLGYTLKVGWRISRSLFGTTDAAIRSLMPHGVLCTLFTILFLTLYLG